MSIVIEKKGLALKKLLGKEHAPTVKIDDREFYRIADLNEAEQQRRVYESVKKTNRQHESTAPKSYIHRTLNVREYIAPKDIKILFSEEQIEQNLASLVKDGIIDEYVSEGNEPEYVDSEYDGFREQKDGKIILRNSK